MQIKAEINNSKTFFSYNYSLIIITMRAQIKPYKSCYVLIHQSEDTKVKV